MSRRRYPCYDVQLSLFTYGEALINIRTRELYRVLNGDISDVDLNHRVLQKVIDHCVKEAFNRELLKPAQCKAAKEYKKLWDRGICWVCGEKSEYLECGHLIDKICGGSDLFTNIKPMCPWCNRIAKPFHKTMSEVMAWRAEIRSQAKTSGLLDRMFSICHDPVIMVV